MKIVKAATLLGLAMLATACGSGGGDASVDVSSIDAGRPTIRLFAEEPTSSHRTTLGIYAIVTGLDRGTLLLSSREAQICPAPTSVPTDTVLVVADAGAPACGVEVSYPVLPGTHQFVATLEPATGVDAPLLVASLFDADGHLLQQILRRFVVNPPPVTDGGLDDAPSVDGEADASSDGEDASIDGDDGGSPSDIGLDAGDAADEIDIDASLDAGAGD